MACGAECLVRAIQIPVYLVGCSVEQVRRVSFPYKVGGIAPILSVRNATNALREIDEDMGTNSSVSSIHHQYSGKRSSSESPVQIPAAGLLKGLGLCNPVAKGQQVVLCQTTTWTATRQHAIGKPGHYE